MKGVLFANPFICFRNVQARGLLKLFFWPFKMAARIMAMPMLLMGLAVLSILGSRELFGGNLEGPSVCGGYQQYVALVPGFLISSVFLVGFLKFFQFSRWKVALLLAVMALVQQATVHNAGVDYGDLVEAFQYLNRHCVDYAFIWQLANWCVTLAVLDLLQFWQSRCEYKKMMA